MVHYFLSSDPFYIVTYYIKWVTTSWTDGSKNWIYVTVISANIQLFVIATRRSNLRFTMFIAISQNYDSSCVHNVSFNQRLRLRSVLEDLVGYESGFRKGQNWISKIRPNIARLIESTKKSRTILPLILVST